MLLRISLLATIVLLLNQVIFSQIYSVGNDDGFGISCVGGLNTEVPLPITLIKFSAYLENSEVKLEWQTASEINNDYFTIERTYEGSMYEFVGQKNGGGTCVVFQYYTLWDDNIRKEIIYYRLKQTDFDGKFSYSNLVSVDNREKSNSNKISTITNLLGQEINENYHGFIIITYEDGRSKKLIQ
jgi:hypothetical protein